MMLLRKIDELTESDHYFIDSQSNCFYYAEYPSGMAAENRNNPIFQLIHNIKKSMDRKGRYEWKYKQIGIDLCIREITEIFRASHNLGEFTMIPIPPSKIRSSPLYDRRMTTILEGVAANFNNADVKDILFCTENMNSHESDIRPTIDELYQNYSLEQQLIGGVRQKVILFDDVLTTGAHFQAAKRKILEINPFIEVYGSFIARRVLPDVSFDFDNDILPF